VAIASTAVTVTTSATALYALDMKRRSSIVSVASGGATVYVGGADVTTANGFPIVAGSTFPVSQGYNADSTPIYALYGIVAAATQEVRVLQATD
jgi:Ca2+-binding RTX toxin-like protein